MPDVLYPPRPSMFSISTMLFGARPPTATRYAFVYRSAPTMANAFRSLLLYVPPETVTRVEMSSEVSVPPANSKVADSSSR